MPFAPSEARSSTTVWTGEEFRAIGANSSAHVRIHVDQRSQSGFVGNNRSWTAERYSNKQLDTWWSQLPALDHVMERLHKTFKTMITPTQSMKLLTQGKTRSGRGLSTISI